MFKTKKYNIILFILMSSMNYSQSKVYDGYPKGQFFYNGGKIILMKEIKEIIKYQDLQPCTNNEEKYTIPIVVNADSSVNTIKYSDSINIAKNKCAYDFGMKIIPHLKNWNPAKIGSEKVRAIAEIEFSPFFLYHSNEDPLKNKITEPEYLKGIDKFRVEVKDIFIQNLSTNENKISSLIFSVNENGIIISAEIIDDSLSEKEKSDLSYKVMKIRGKWKPGTFNGIPIKRNMRISLRQEFDFEPEKRRTKSYFDKLLPKNAW